MVTELTRKYWLDTLLGWAEARLPPPQLDECCAALDFAVYQTRTRNAANWIRAACEQYPDLIAPAWVYQLTEEN